MNKINEAGYNEAPKFGPSQNNPPYISDDFQIGPNGAYEIEYDFNQVSKEILKSIQMAKQANLLDRSYMKCQHSLSLEHLKMSDIDLDGMVREQIRERFAKETIGITQNQIKTEDYGDCRVYSLELCVFPLEDLKHIVEFCVKEMSMESISKIKNYE